MGLGLLINMHVAAFFLHVGQLRYSDRVFFAQRRGCRIGFIEDKTVYEGLWDVKAQCEGDQANTRN